jgi:hypothetical protein
VKQAARIVVGLGLFITESTVLYENIDLEFVMSLTIFRTSGPSIGVSRSMKSLDIGETSIIVRRESMLRFKRSLDI